ncbi:MAG: cytochrome P450 [Novosphingobium sp.]
MSGGSTKTKRKSEITVPDQNPTAASAGQIIAVSNAPPHVPHSLIWDLDYARFLRDFDDPFVAGCRLHTGPDIVWATRMNRGEAGWLITRHALMEEILMDYENFSAARSDLKPLLGYDIRFYPLDCDPPVHHRFRQTIAPIFTPAAVKRLDSSIRSICHELIGQFGGRENCEFIAEFSSVFPNYVFLELIGMPRDMLPQFLAWNEDFQRGEGMVRVTAARAILAYLQGFLSEQRNNADRTDLMELMLGGREGLEPLDDDEALGMTYMLYVAGLDTVYSTTGWIMKHLATDQQLQDRLRNCPADIPRAIDELTRAYSVSTTTRLVSRDLEFHGISMKAGDTVFMPLYLATRDDQLFADPHRIDIERRSRHLTFGAGAHICLGFHLAKRELAIVVETLLDRYSSITLKEGWHYHSEGPVLGLDTLPLHWTLAQNRKE